MSELFEEGGELNVRRKGSDEYQMSVALPTDEDGLAGRECPNKECSPAYFKVKPGTGITGEQTTAYCPYCRRAAEPGDFLTKAQREYAESLVVREAHKGIDRMIRRSLGIGSSGRKKIGSGMFSMEMTYKPGPLPHPALPIEEALRRDITCPSCGLEHAVFGLATWCPDCGGDIFLTHLDFELETIRKSLAVVDDRRAQLGKRLAAKDTENALEDVVSIFEATLKIVIRRLLVSRGAPERDIADLFDRKIRNQFQNPTAAEALLHEHASLQLFAGFTEQDRAFLCDAFEKRHPITHNLGVVDRKYLQRAMSGDPEGSEIRLSCEEVTRLANTSQAVLSAIYRQAFPGSQIPPNSELPPAA